MSDLGGGTGDHLLSLIHRWDDRWRSRILSEQPITSRLEADVPVDLISSGGWLDRYPLAQWRRLRRARSLLAKEPPDILHCYFYWSILYGRILKRLGVIRCLIENREDEGYSWSRGDYLLLRRTRSQPDRIICVSEAVRQVVLEREGIEPERTLVIHNGVEPIVPRASTRWKVRAELGIGVSEVVVGMVSNLNRKIKGVRYFLQAIPHILAAEPATRFVIFGSGDEESRLRRLARDLGILGRLTFAGFRSDIDRFYPALDISVLTSLSEGLSISLLQSMNNGLPVVATRVGGNPEVVVDGETGYLVPPRDPARFAEMVVKLVRDREARERMGRAARHRIEARFHIAETAERYLQTYEALLGRCHSGSVRGPGTFQSSLAAEEAVGR